MDLATYQEAQAKTAAYPGQNSTIGLLYSVLELTASAGDVADTMTTIIKENAPNDDELLRGLGRVLWDLSAVANEIGLTLEDIAEVNLDTARKGL